MTAAAGAAAARRKRLAVITASKTDSKTFLGEGDHFKYEIVHSRVAPTPLAIHLADDAQRSGRQEAATSLCSSTKEIRNSSTIPRFSSSDADGKYIRSFGKQFQECGHGIEIRDEGGQEFLYVNA